MESFQSVYERIKDFFEELKKSTYENVLIVSHETCITLLEDIILRLDAQKIKLCFVAPYDEIYNQIEAIKKEGFDLLLYKNEQDAIDFALENVKD